LFLYELLGIIYPFGIDVTDGDNLSLPEPHESSHIADALAPDTDTTKCYAIARRIGAKDRSRYDCRDQKTSCGNDRAFKKLPASYNVCLSNFIAFHISTLSQVFQ